MAGQEEESENYYENGEGFFMMVAWRIWGLTGGSPPVVEASLHYGAQREVPRADPGSRSFASLRGKRILDDVAI